MSVFPRGPVKTFFSLQGRATRKEYWLTAAVWNGLFYVGILLYPYLESEYAGSGRSAVEPMAAAASVWLTLSSISKFSVAFRRAHDHGYSGALGFIALVPLIGPLIDLTLFGLLKGMSGDNRFGPDPRLPPPPQEFGLTRLK